MADTQETLHFLDYWRVISSRKEVVIAVALLLILAGIVVTELMPRVYMASTVVAVREELPDVEIFASEMARFNPLFLPTQFEIIQSRPVLDEVIRRQGLVEKLGRAYNYLDEPMRFEITYKILSDSMKVQQYRDTNLIQIKILLSEPKETVVQEVADTANMVAAVFRDQRTERTREETERALRALYESFEEQRQKVAAQEKKVDEIRQKYGIDVLSSETGTETALGKRSLAQLEEQRLMAKLGLAEAEGRLNSIERIPQDQLPNAAPYLVEDPALVDLITQERRLAVEMNSLKESYGANHPRVQTGEAALATLQVKIREALNGLKAGMKTRYEAAKKKYEILEAEMETLKSRERSAEALSYREFDEAVQELAHLRKIRDVLEMRHLQERIRMQIPRTTVEVVEPAQPPDPDMPVRPNLLLNMVLSIIVGLGSGIGLAFFIEYLDTSIKTIEDIEQYIGSPVLGVIPQKVRPITVEDAAPAQAETYRVLRTNIRFSKKLAEGKTVCCTSGSVGEGKSLTIYNLGVVCSQLGDKTLIVDSDLHRPRQHKMMGLSNERGLANVLVGDIEVEDAILSTPFPNLSLMPSGRLSSGSHGLLDTRRMKDIVAKVRDRFDLILFDTPPIIGVSDASLLAREMDGVLLVIQHRKYPRAVSKRARDMLDNMGANLVGVVLNNVNISRDYSYYYYYHHYYSYYTKGQKT